MASPPVLSEADKVAIRERLAALTRDVRLRLFTRADPGHDVPGEAACETCPATEALLRALASLNDHLRLEIVDVAAHPAAAADAGVSLLPTIAVDPADARGDRGVRFVGLPGAYEYTALVETIVSAGGGSQSLRPETLARLAGMTGPVELMTFVTPTCPRCPGAVLTAHRLALASPWVRSTSIEAHEFPGLAATYRVTGVPKVVVNGGTAIQGAISQGALVDAIVSAGRCPAPPSAP